MFRFLLFKIIFQCKSPVSFSQGAPEIVYRQYLIFYLNIKSTKFLSHLFFFNLEYDCPLIPDIMTMIQWIAGGTIAAAESLSKQECQIVINWGGGWHHSQRDEASGFCYVNDIVLGKKGLSE